MWDTIMASDYCLNVTDGTHDSPKKTSTGKYLITSKHIKGREIDFDSAYFISQSDYEKINLRSRVDQWDIIISMIGEYCGFCYLEKNPVIDYAIKNVGLFKTGSREKALWLYYYLISPQGKAYLQSVRAGSSQPYISLTELRKLPIPLPDASIREKTIKLLSAFDEKIETNDRMVKNLQAQAVAIFEKRFSGMLTGDHSVGDYITPQKGKSLLSKDAIPGDVPVVAGGLEPSCYHNIANTSSPVVTISASGANAGYINIWNKPVWSSDSSFIDSSMTADVYFWYVLLKKRQNEIYNLQTGSAQAHIYPKHIAALPIGRLDLSVVSHFSKECEQLFGLINTATQETEQLLRIRNYLIGKAMSNELDYSGLTI